MTSERLGEKVKEFVFVDVVDKRMGSGRGGGEERMGEV